MLGGLGGMGSTPYGTLVLQLERFSRVLNYFQRLGDVASYLRQGLTEVQAGISDMRRMT